MTEFDQRKLLRGVRTVRKTVVRCTENRAEAVAIVTTVLAGLMSDGVSPAHREEFLENTTALLRSMWARFDAERSVM